MMYLIYFFSQVVRWIEITFFKVNKWGVFELQPLHIIMYGKDAPLSSRMQMPIPIRFSLLGKDASILHFIRPLFGLLHLIILADCECSPFPLTTLLFNLAFRAAFHSYNKEDALSKTMFCASVTSFQILLFRCFHMLHKIVANKGDSSADRTCNRWKNSSAPVQTLSNNNIDSI